MDPLARLAGRAASHSLTLVGTLDTTDDPDLPDGQTLALLGPAEPGFWAHMTAEPEFRDGAPDPMDRWSTRVITALASGLGGTAFFPFGTPPRPFLRWALATGQVHLSPVHLLVHQAMGLWVSFRGAILLPESCNHAAPSPSPCDTCAGRPCLSACPVQALTDAQYDLPACHAYLDTAPGADCMTRGCAVRRACPAAQGYGRAEAQSAFHMREFHR